LCTDLAGTSIRVFNAIDTVGARFVRVRKHLYHSDLQRYALAARMVQHEARLATIRRWTGLSVGRVQELYQTYGSDKGPPRTARHRGLAPRQPALFLRTAHLRNEAAAFVALCCLFEIIPPRPVPNARRELPDLRRGELLCLAYEMYRSFVSPSEITLDHAALLVIAIAQGTQLRMAHCTCCGGVILFNPLDSSRRICSYCRPGTRQEIEMEGAASRPSAAREEGLQRSLF
jgi:hypothetical protein